MCLTLSLNLCLYLLCQILNADVIIINRGGGGGANNVLSGDHHFITAAWLSSRLSHLGRNYANLLPNRDQRWV